MKKPKFDNGKTVLKEVQKIASKHGVAVTRWAAAKWLSNTAAKSRLLREKRRIESELARIRG